jgi:hypothetical protein
MIKALTDALMEQSMRVAGFRQARKVGLPDNADRRRAV